MADERGSLIGYQPELSQIVRTMEIENGPDMEQAARGMSVVARFQSEGFHDRLQPADVIGQLRRTNRCVFNERDRFRWTDAAGQKGNAGFAHPPNEIPALPVSPNPPP